VLDRDHDPYDTPSSDSGGIQVEPAMEALTYRHGADSELSEPRSTATRV
jgi:hypothetical protein